MVSITTNTLSVILITVYLMISSALTDTSLQNLDASPKTKSEGASSSSKNAKSLNLLSSLRQQILDKETELENAEKINRNFERMIQLVNIMGQVDTFLTDRTKVMLKKLALLADDMDGAESPRRSGGGSYDIRF